MAPGSRSRFGTPKSPMFESELFRKQIYCIAESTCNIVGIIGVPHSDLATEELHPSFFIASPSSLLMSSSVSEQLLSLCGLINSRYDYIFTGFMFLFLFI